MTSAARRSLRQKKTIIATTNPQEIPRKRAVANSLRNATINQRHVRLADRKAWIVTVIDCMLTLSFRPRTMVRKKATIRLFSEVPWKAPARIAQTVPVPTDTRSQGKR